MDIFLVVVSQVPVWIGQNKRPERITRFPNRVVFHREAWVEFDLRTIRSFRGLDAITIINWA